MSYSTSRLFILMVKYSRNRSLVNCHTFMRSASDYRAMPSQALRPARCTPKTAESRASAYHIFRRPCADFLPPIILTKGESHAKQPLPDTQLFGFGRALRAGMLSYDRNDDASPVTYAG